MKLVGASGMAGSGKDSFADFLVRDHGYVKIAFADPIKRAAADWFGWDAERLWGPSEKRNEPDLKYRKLESVLVAQDEYEQRFDEGLSARKALQFMGTEIGRTLYPDLWVEYALRTAKRILEGKNGIYRVYDPKIGLDPVNAFVSTFWPPKGVIIADVRFVNEVNALKKAGAYLVRFRRGEALKGDAGLHRSETEMQGIPDNMFDRIIDNREMTLEQLREAAKLVAEEIK